MMSISPESRCEPVFARRPPAFPAADDYDTVGLQNPADGFRKIPAKIDSDTGIHRLFARHGEKLLFRELHRYLRRLEFQWVGNHLGDMHGDPSAQAASQPAGDI